ncbi:MAG TPA: 4-alpha-glucanotransferase [Acidobacteriaceae bacterium]|nr:4-alpha-glucanotransferase [Acidobacteriaceae bacterium]
MPFDRSSGLLLHITSLPSLGGIGDLGPAAYDFANFLAASKQRLWQVLPLSPTGYGNSPYAALSAFAGNPLLISLERLANRGWISYSRLTHLPGRSGNVDYDTVIKTKMPLLEEAARNFLHHHDSEEWSRYEAYTRTNWTWLESYALYSVLRKKYNSAAWNVWPADLAHRDPQILDCIRHEHGEEIAIQQILQFTFDDQWTALREYCGERGIKLIGDVAIFVNYDSADVWTRPDLFELDEHLAPTRVAGVPPDYFSATGQRWGNPLYRWDVMRRNEYAWWIDRMSRARHLYDIIRLDHFRGFEAYWAIPAANKTAEHGEWVKAPGVELFETIGRALGDLPFIAEDLGVITPEVDALRDRFRFPGMRILQFGFGSKKAHDYLPHRYINNCVVYTGTHDNNTTQGWWDEEATKAEKAAAKVYLGTLRKDFVWAMIRAVETSVADLCIVPVQDLLCLPEEARMNMPSRAGGNWRWRCPENALTSEIAAKLGALAETADRN